MDHEQRVNGALIFWSYIFAALLFTSLAVEAIAKQASRSILHVREWKKQLVKRFCVLAVLSLSTLSFNMLHVLTYSYQAWAMERFPGQAVSKTLSIYNTWDWSTRAKLYKTSETPLLPPRQSTCGRNRRYSPLLLLVCIWHTEVRIQSLVASTCS